MQQQAVQRTAVHSDPVPISDLAKAFHQDDAANSENGCNGVVNGALPAVECSEVELDVVRRLLASHRCDDARDLVLQLKDSRDASDTLELLLSEIYIAESKLSDATACIMALLGKNPNNPTTLQALVKLYRSSGDILKVLETVRKLASLPSQEAGIKKFCADVFVEIAISVQTSGDASTALELFADALEACPSHDVALFEMGVLAMAQGSQNDAIALYQRAVKANPANVQAWTNLGALLRNSGALAEAQAALQEALSHAPSDRTILANLSALHVAIGSASPASARASYDRALAYNPANCDALYNLAVQEAGDQNFEKALFYYQTCVRAQPQHSLAWNNLGVVYQQVDNMPCAIECYEAAVATKPDFSLALNNLGVLYTAQGHSGKAERHLRAAIASNNEYAEAHNNMGVLLRDRGLVAEAIEFYQECMRLCSENPNAFQNRLLALNYIHQGEAPLVCEAHAEWGREYLRQLTQHLPPIQRSAWPPLAGRRLRVGYLSPDLYRHSVSYFAEAPLSHHDRQRVEDAKSAHLRATAEAAGCVWRSVASMPEAELAGLIRSDAVDVLIELTGHTAHNRLNVMRRRPAAVQMTWIGYPNSTGLPTVDFRITDALCDPLDTQQTFTEDLIRLPGCFLCYTPMQDPPPVAPAPCLAHGYVTFGSFNALAKVTEEVVETWCQILMAVPRSRLLLKNKPFLCTETQRQWLRRFTARGVPGWRVSLLPLTAGTGDHMSQYAMMDISLDPWPYAGTTTTCESLFMGVPVVTLCGACHAHNVGKSLLTTIGIAGDWACMTREEYVACAVRWAGDHHKLAKLRGSLRGTMLGSPLCAARPFMKGVEDELQLRFERWHRGVGRGAGACDEEAVCAPVDTVSALESTSATAAHASGDVAKASCRNDSEQLLGGAEGLMGAARKVACSHRRKRAQSAEPDDARAASPASHSQSPTHACAARMTGADGNDMEHQEQNRGGARSVNDGENDDVNSVNGRFSNGCKLHQEVPWSQPADTGMHGRAVAPGDMEGVEVSGSPPCASAAAGIRKAFAADRAAFVSKLAALAKQHGSEYGVLQPAGHSHGAAAAGHAGTGCGVHTAEGPAIAAGTGDAGGGAHGMTLPAAADTPKTKEDGSGGSAAADGLNPVKEGAVPPVDTAVAGNGRMAGAAVGCAGAACASWLEDPQLHVAVHNDLQD